jgi:hypothetical protein
MIRKLTIVATAAALSIAALVAASTADARERYSNRVYAPSYRIAPSYGYAPSYPYAASSPYSRGGDFQLQGRNGE